MWPLGTPVAPSSSRQLLATRLAVLGPPLWTALGDLTPGGPPWKARAWRQRDGVARANLAHQPDGDQPNQCYGISLLVVRVSPEHAPLPVAFCLPSMSSFVVVAVLLLRTHSEFSPAP